MVVCKSSFPIVAGKKYEAEVYVRVNDPDLPADPSVPIRINNDGATDFVVDEIVEEYTIGDIKSAPETFPPQWYRLRTRITALATKTTTQLNLVVVPDDFGDIIPDFPAKAIFVDSFIVREYEEVPDVPACDLAIDPDATIITNESAVPGNDGSIEVAITGGDAPFEYSKDNGANWQASNQFLGLASGIYHVKVRDTNGCEDDYFFEINQEDPAFDFTLAITDETISGANNGSIAITTAGPGAPFTFSKDGGANYQGGNVFNNLPPGTYYIAVKDSTGVVLIKQAVVNAGVVIFEKVYFSKNPITLLKQASAGWEALNNYRLYDDVRAEDDAGTSIYNSKIRIDQPPDSDGQVEFNVREAFRDVLEATPPNYNESSIIKLTDRIKRFKHYTGELQDDETIPAVLTDSNPFLVLLGGIDKLRFPTLNFFYTYMQANKKFLTWAPAEKEVDRSQEDYLNFWIHTLSITTIKVQIKAYFDDATNQTSTVKTKAGVVYGELYQIPAGPVNSGVLDINPAKNLVKYELSLLDQADTLISEVRTYLVKTTRHPLTRFFMFLNSLGSYEVLRFTGQNDRTAEYSREVIQKHLANSWDPTDGEFEINNTRAQEKGNISSGYFRGRYAAQWQEYMQDLLLSSRVFELVGQTRKPITINAGSYTFKADQDYERFVRFEVNQAYQNDVYTPETT